MVDGVFSAFQPSIDRNISKYDAAIEQRKEAGKRSAEKRKRDATTVDESKRDATTVESRLRTSTVSDSVSDSVSDTLSLNGESVREGIKFSIFNQSKSNYYQMKSGKNPFVCNLL